MGRPVILGNGALTVGLNEHGLVHDFYYPYVGLDNLTTARSMHHKIGVWVDGIFAWTDDGQWQICVDFEEGALVSTISMRHDGLQVELTAYDFVDPRRNVFGRRITITNAADEDREIRVFMHQVFQISRAGRADTALYEPDEHYLLDYKGRCCLLIGSRDTQGDAFNQFSVGNYGIEGKEGTYRDAEDGVLSGNGVEHGGVDSVIGITGTVAAGQDLGFDYWVVAADSQQAAEIIHRELLTDGLAASLIATREYWHDWLAIGGQKIADCDPQYRPLLKKSLMVIKAHTDKRGGIIASCDSSIYNYGRDYYSYVWPRDGAYAMWPLIRLGYQDEPKRFFSFCRDIITTDGYLMHKYQPDKAIGSTWHPLLHGRHSELAIQEDETAGVLYMLGEYQAYSHDDDFVASLYDTFVKPAAGFLARFIDSETGLPHASYDLWEEKFLSNAYTAAITYQALLTAADFADQYEYPDDAVSWRQAAGHIQRCQELYFDPERQAIRKGFLLQPDGSLQYDNTLDISSLYGVVMYGLQPAASHQVQSTLQLVESELLNKSPSGGSPRYEHDNYFAVDGRYQGNPWFVTTLWLAQLYAKIGRSDEARALLDWTAQRTLPGGVLSEQVNPTDSTPLSVAPLVWSHAEFINTVLDLNKK